MKPNQPNLKSLLIVLSMAVGHLTLGQSHLQAYNEGIKNLNKGNYEKAIANLKESVNLNEKFADSWYYLGIVFGLTGQWEESAYSFKRLEGVSPGYNPWFYYEATKAYIAQNNFTDAQASIDKFMTKFPKGPKNTLFHHMGKNRLEYIQKSPGIRAQAMVMTEPKALDQINSISGDYSPQVNPTGTRLYFTSVRKGGFDRQDDSTQVNNWGEDIYVSDLMQGKWSAPKLLPQPLNSIGDDFGSAFTGDGQTMVYVKCGDKESIGNCDLYITQLVGTEWAMPVNMGNVVNSDDWDSQPTISSDGNRIFFTSARKGGYGGSDIYMTEKNHLGDWGIPQNLGSTVNTPLNENSPYLAPDGKTLYYATDGHPGYGGTDIFYTNFDNGKWSAPINVGAPINSEGDDTNFSISASGTGYLASSRLDAGNYDLFEVELPDHLKPKPTVVIQGIVTNAKSSEPLGAWLLLEDINSGEMIAINKSNSASGEYLVVLPAGRNYSLSANSDGFFFYSESFELPKDTTYQEIVMNIALEPIEKGTKVVLNNIFFDPGKSTLKPISYVELNKAVDLLKKNSTMVIEVGGHTDNVGSDELNMRLSEGRATSVMSYITLAGVDPSRVQAKGYGETQPLADNTTEAGRAANRRTEFVIVEF